jgi:hypothetical protein
MSSRTARPGLRGILRRTALPLQCAGHTIMTASFDLSAPEHGTVSCSLPPEDVIPNSPSRAERDLTSDSITIAVCRTYDRDSIISNSAPRHGTVSCSLPPGNVIPNSPSRAERDLTSDSITIAVCRTYDPAGTMSTGPHLHTFARSFIYKNPISSKGAA